MDGTTEISRSLRVQLTEQDVNLLARRSAKLQGERRRFYEEKKSTAKFYAAEIEKRDVEISGLADDIESGWQNRSVACSVLFNSPRDGFKTTVRLDTGEEVEVEPMTDQERQEPLPFPGPKPTLVDEVTATDESAAPADGATDADAQATPEALLYIEGSTCQTCQGSKYLADGTLACPDCLADGRQRVC